MLTVYYKPVGVWVCMHTCTYVCDKFKAAFLFRFNCIKYIYNGRMKNNLVDLVFYDLSAEWLFQQPVFHRSITE